MCVGADQTGITLFLGNDDPVGQVSQFGRQLNRDVATLDGVSEYFRTVGGGNHSAVAGQQVVVFVEVVDRTARLGNVTDDRLTQDADAVIQCGRF